MSELLLALALMCQERNTHYGDIAPRQKMCVAKLLKCIGNISETTRLKTPDKIISCLEDK